MTLGPCGFKVGSNPGLGAAIVVISPAEIGGGAPDPAQVAAVDCISVSFFFAIAAALASL